VISHTSSSIEIKKTYLFNAIADDIARHLNLPPLTKSNGSSNSLVLDAGVPLKLNDENTIGTGEIKTGKVSRCKRSRVPVTWVAYPNAPVPVVMMSTGLDRSLENSSRMAWRFARGQSPSTRKYDTFSRSRCLATRFKVRVQQEKIMLRQVSTPFILQSRGVDLPFR
jgi:hypothetical protein